jgi:tetratricopeptide (TPR) repeat protein
VKINRILLLFAVFPLFLNVYAQTADDVGKIALSVVMPDNVEGLTVAQLSKLESKIRQIATKAGLAASGYNQTFVIYPQFAVYESKVVEGGMQNIMTVTVELSLFIKQVSNNLLFSSVSRQLKGSGKSEEIAITNVISQIPVSDEAFTSFIDDAKQKIIQYYEANCDEIVKKADNYIKMQQYEQALGLLMSIPEEISACYDKILSKSIDTYKAYQKQVCSENLLKAKTLVASMDYNEALNVLSEIDPSTDCFKEALTLVKSIENKVNAENKKQWDFQMKQYNNAVSLEKQRINAVKEIAVSYYKSQPTSVHYNYIVR